MSPFAPLRAIRGGANRLRMTDEGLRSDFRSDADRPAPRGRRTIGLQQSEMTRGGPQDDSAGAEPPVCTLKLAQYPIAVAGLATPRWIAPLREGGGATRRGQVASTSTHLAYLTPSAWPESTPSSPLLSLFDPLPTGRTGNPVRTVSNAFSTSYSDIPDKSSAFCAPF